MDTIKIKKRHVLGVLCGELANQFGYTASKKLEYRER
jgi:hypothetical protein